jgi:hypothetical protein
MSVIVAASVPVADEGARPWLGTQYCSPTTIPTAGSRIHLSGGSSRGPMVRRLAGGESWIRTPGPATVPQPYSSLECKNPMKYEARNRKPSRRNW